MIRILMLGAFLFSSVAFSAEIYQVDGVSEFRNNKFSPTIYAGLGGRGLAKCTTTEPNTTCDGCASSDGLQLCNRRRVFPGNFFSIKVKTTYRITARPVLYFNSQLILTGEMQKDATIFSLPASWNAVCLALGNSTCEFSEQRKGGAFRLALQRETGKDYEYESLPLTIMIVNPDPFETGDYDQIDDCSVNSALSPSKPGICGFKAYSGDGKAIVQDFEAGMGFPYSVGGSFTSVNFYLSNIGFINRPSEGSVVSFGLVKTKDGVSLDGKEIGELPNGMGIYMRSSVVDEAGNEMFFTSDANILAACGSMWPRPPFDGSNGSQVCPYAVYPEKIVEAPNGRR